MKAILSVVSTFLLLSGCATHLTENGRRIKVVYQEDLAMVKKCVRLDAVRGKAGSFLSGGEYGVVFATKDARNKAGNIPAATTLLIENNDPKRFGGEVSGIAYNCPVSKK